MQKFALILIFFSCAAILPAQNNRFYVDPTAFGQNNGQCWYDAFTNLHDALALAVKGDEIWVAQGIYRPTSNNNRDAHFELLSGVRLLGGFAGTEMDVTERNIEAHPSFLDGDIGTPGDSTDNSYNLLYLYRPDITTLVDGFTFRYAFANKPGVAKALPGVSGSALYMMAADGEAYATVKNSKFLYNTSLSDGGAVYINGYGDGSVAPVFSNCEFIACQSKSGYGGAFCRYGGSKIDRPADLEFCLFKGNVSYRRGGAIYFIDSPGIDTFDIVNCIMTENLYTFPANESANNLDIGSVLYWEFPRYIGGTSIKLTNSKLFHNSGILLGIQLVLFEVGDSRIIIDSCLFTDNKTGTLSGETFGGIKVDIFNSVFSTSSITFSSNSDDSKVGSNKIINSSLLNCSKVIISMKGTVLIIKNSSFKDNYENEISLTGNSILNNALIDNCLFANNGHLNQINSTYEFTGAKIKASDVLVRNNTLYNNLVIENPFYPPQSNFIYENCIVNIQDTAHLKSYINEFNKVGNVKYKFINNIINLPQISVLSVSKDSINLWSTDPMFVAPDSGNFQLQACSPAINAGINDGQLSATDLLGQPRVQFGAVDMGPIEAGPLALYAPAEITPACTSTASNGAINISTLDMCAPALYIWSTGVTGVDLPVQQGLTPGNYTVTVSDTKGRSVVLSLNVPLALTPQLGIDKQALQCGDTIGGKLAAIINGGTGPFQFNWGFSNDSLVTGLAAGIYQVTVTDRLGCTTSATAEVVREGALSLTVDVDPISCFGSNDGGLTILPANGKAPFTWLWDDGSNTPTLAPLGPGIYQGVLTDALGCKIQWYLPLTEPGVLQLSAQVDPASGPQVADGRIQLDSISGGTMPYSAGWSNGMNGLEINGLLPGMYTCTLTDANGCVVTRTFQVPFTNATTSATQESDYTIFPNPNNGTFTLEGIGQGTMQFEIFDAGGKRVWGQDFTAIPGIAFTQPIRTNLPAGGYHWSLKTGQTISKGLLFVQ
jgi:hypothetical protein